MVIGPTYNKKENTIEQAKSMRSYRISYKRMQVSTDLRTNLRTLSKMLYDEDSGLELPRAINELRIQKPTDIVSRDAKGQIPLEHVEIESHYYENSGSTGFSIFKSIFSSSFDAVSSGVIQEAKRFTIKEVDGQSVELGVAVRLAVATNAANLNAQLSPENLAAAAQLGLAQTRVKIKVAGFDGDIVDLPGVASLDVKNYQSYLDSFNNIQDQVFSVSGRKDWIPTILKILDS